MPVKHILYLKTNKYSHSNRLNKNVKAQRHTIKEMEYQK